MLLGIQGHHAFYIYPLLQSRSETNGARKVQPFFDTAMDALVGFIIILAGKFLYCFVWFWFKMTVQNFRCHVYSQLFMQYYLVVLSMRFCKTFSKKIFLEDNSDTLNRINGIYGQHGMVNAKILIDQNHTLSLDSHWQVLPFYLEK